MRTSLEELYTQYELSIEKQKKTIEENRIKLKDAHLRHNLGEVERLNRLLRLLYEEKLELEGAAIDIREYFH
ncbi:MAG: hypothetical protein E7538_04975 [Ruminococcaceae bacterium]|nr:hypothetical protein [Oscillospiraceae bacterium]